LAIGQWVNVATGPAGTLFYMSGYEKILRNDIFFVTLLGVSISTVLIPLYGVNGAALSTTIALTVLNLLLLWQTRLYIFRGANLLNR
jgi:hypothetical protein